MPLDPAQSGCPPAADSVSSVLYSGGYVDITPSTSLQLVGWQECHRGMRVADRLEANALLIQAGEKRIFFVQADLLSVGEEVRRRILARLAGRLTSAELFLVASHTHFAPCTDLRLGAMGKVDPGYLEYVAARIGDLLETLLLQSPQRVCLRYGESMAAHSVNRRRWCLAPALRIPPVKRVMALHPNPAGPNDQRVRVVGFAADPAGPPAGILWSYACHAVGYYDRSAVSADFPGRIRQVIRRSAGADIPVVFLPGFAGNVRPGVVARFPKSPYYLLHRIVNGPVFGRFDPDSWNRWTSSLAGVVMSAWAGSTVLGAVSTVRSCRFVQPLAELMEGKLDDRPLSYHLVALGDSHVFVGISAEPMIEYVDAVAKMFPGRVVVPVGYIDGVIGYLPTSEMLAEGGLEVMSLRYALDKARFRDTVSQDVIEAIRSLAQQHAAEAAPAGSSGGGLAAPNAPSSS
jgi:hypothetical protein